MSTIKFRFCSLVIFFFISISSFGQFRAKEINWTTDGTAYLQLKDGNIARTDIKTNAETVIVKTGTVNSRGRR